MALPAVILVCSTIGSPVFQPSCGTTSTLVAVPKTCEYVVEVWDSCDASKPRRKIIVRATNDESAMRSAKEQYGSSLTISANICEKRDCE
jgi:hypothetical protein